MIDVGRAYLCVRDLDPSSGGLVLPAAWQVTPQDAGWYTLTRESDGLTVAAWRANSAGTRALFALFGPIALLGAVAAVEPACMPAREAWARRAEPAVRVWLRRWLHWRIDGQVRDGAGVAQPVTAQVVQLVPESAAIPDPPTTPLPWLLRADGTVTTVAAQAQVRVTAIHRPAMGHTLAGFALHSVCEDEPERR